MLYGKKDTLDYFRKIDKKYFALFKKGTIGEGNPIFRTEEEKESTSDDALRNFEEVLNWLKSGDYSVVCNNDPKVSNRGGFREDFRITMDDSIGSQARDAVSGIGSVSAPAVDVDALMAKAKQWGTEEFEKQMAKRDLEDLKKNHEQLQKDLKDATSKLDDPINKFIGALAPHADGLIGAIMGKTASPLLTNAVSGVRPDLHLDENATTEEFKDHAQTVFEDFATTLQTIKPTEWLEILVKLTTLMKNNPQKFETALNFL